MRNYFCNHKVCEENSARHVFNSRQAQSQHHRRDFPFKRCRFPFPINGNVVSFVQRSKQASHEKNQKQENNPLHPYMALWSTMSPCLTFFTLSAQSTLSLRSILSRFPRPKFCKLSSLNSLKQSLCRVYPLF